MGQVNVENNVECINEQMNALRKERDECYDKARDIQTQIDELDLKKHNMDQYLHQYIRLVNWTVNSTLLYVKSINRLFHGAKFKGDIIIIYPDGFGVFYDSEITYDYEDKNIIINILTKEEYNQHISDVITNIKEKYIHG